MLTWAPSLTLGFDEFLDPSQARLGPLKDQEGHGQQRGRTRRR